MSSLVVSRW